MNRRLRKIERFVSAVGDREPPQKVVFIRANGQQETVPDDFQARSDFVDSYIRYSEAKRRGEPIEPDWIVRAVFWDEDINYAKSVGREFSREEMEQIRKELAEIGG